MQRAWAEVLHRRGEHGDAWDALRRAADRLGAAATDHRCMPPAAGRLSDGAGHGHVLGRVRAAA